MGQTNRNAKDNKWQGVLGAELRRMPIHPKGQKLEAGNLTELHHQCSGHKEQGGVIKTLENLSMGCIPHQQDQRMEAGKLLQPDVIIGKSKMGGGGQYFNRESQTQLRDSSIPEGIRERKQESSSSRKRHQGQRRQMCMQA